MNSEQEEKIEVPWWAKSWDSEGNGTTVKEAVKIEKWSDKEGERWLTTLVLSITEDGLPCVTIWEGDLKDGKDEYRSGPNVIDETLEDVFAELRAAVLPAEDEAGWV